MRYRPLGMAACVLATLFPTPAPAQGCDQILTFRLWEDTPPLSLWIGERILSGRADPSCGGEEALGVRWWEKKVARAAAGCEPVKGAMEGPSSVPNVTKLKLSYLNAFCDVVAVGEVTGTEVGLYGQGDNADVYTRVRIRVTEMIRNVPRGGEVGDSLTFLVPGGSLTTSRGQHFCSELPPWARDWQPGGRSCSPAGTAPTTPPSCSTISFRFKSSTAAPSPRVTSCPMRNPSVSKRFVRPRAPCRRDR